mmetsp:Transcript_2992/g.8957  ORF Transcript_2992/g.8957 Transcript_2992/m.8957 type:complete len:1166 (+) Transcript_2992:1503-5000(+)
MLEGRDLKLLDEKILIQYFVREFWDHPDWLSMLTQALDMRALVVVLDGIDEAAGRRDSISALVCDVLVPFGLRVFCTSRPEGVDIELFKSRFVILDLKPLSEQQQQKAIEVQMQMHPFGKTFSRHLLAFSAIRAEHDRIYREVAFPSAAERARIEEFEAPNLQFHNGKDGERDQSMRQRAVNGDLCCVSKSPIPASGYLQELNEKLAPALTEIDSVLETQSNASEASLQQQVEQILSAQQSSATKALLSVATRLVLLVQKRRKALLAMPTAGGDIGMLQRRTLEYIEAVVPQTTATQLWPRIVARTDQIYETVEGLLPIFMAATRHIARSAGLAEADLMFASGLKDPVRVHEKAIDDYLHDFDDWDDDRVIPETCVIDMIRGSVLCSDGMAMLAFLTALRQGFELAIDGKKARLSLLRCKNKFADGGKHEPTRFRNILTNIILDYDGRRAFTELQIHHRAIREHNDASHAHGPYEFFRSLLARAYEKGLDEMLERAILFLTEVRGVPVLLSMLVLIFRSREEDSVEALPASRYELYEMATRLAIREQGGEGMAGVGSALCHIAFANHVAMRREFTSADVREALRDHEVERAAWDALLVGAGVPLVKTIVDAGGGEGVYQFRHLSFQEGLFVLAILGGIKSPSSVWSDATKAVKFLSEPFYANTIRIGGGRLGATLGPTAPTGTSAEDGAWILGSTDETGSTTSVRSRQKGTKRVVNATALLHLLDGNEGIRKLNLANSGMQVNSEAFQSLAGVWSSMSNLTFLDLRRNGLSSDCCQALTKALQGNLALTQLRLGFNKLGSKAGLPLVRLLEHSPSLTALDLENTELDNEFADSLASVLSSNTTLTHLDLGWNPAIQGDAAARLAQTVLGSDSLAMLSRLWLKELSSGTMTQLDCRGRGFGEPEALVLAHLLRSCRSLTVLDASDNPLSGVACSALVQTFTESGSLQRLNLNFNKYTARESTPGIPANLHMSRDPEQLHQELQSAARSKLPPCACFSLRGDEITGDAEYRQCCLKWHLSPVQLTVPSLNRPHHRSCIWCCRLQSVTRSSPSPKYYCMYAAAPSRRDNTGDRACCFALCLAKEDPGGSEREPCDDDSFVHRFCCGACEINGCCAFWLCCIPACITNSVACLATGGCGHATPCWCLKDKTTAVLDCWPVLYNEDSAWK